MTERRQRHSTFILLFISSTKENDLQTEKGRANMAKIKLKPYVGKGNSENTVSHLNARY